MLDLAQKNKKLLSFPKLPYPKLKGTYKVPKPIKPIVKIYDSLIGGNKKKSGRAVLICCPFHGENNPSCALYEDTNSYYCFSCGVHGDYIEFVKQYLGIDFREALLEIEKI